MLQEEFRVVKLVFRASHRIPQRDVQLRMEPLALVWQYLWVEHLVYKYYQVLVTLKRNWPAVW